MSAFRLRSWGLAGFGIVVLAATPAMSQGLGAATTDEIVASAKSCAMATSPGGIDVTRLAADGWSKGSISNAGKPVDSPLTIYGKGHVAIMLTATGSGSACIAIAELSSAKQFAAVQTAFAAAYGGPVKDDGKGEQVFLTPGTIVSLASTGSVARPAVRIGVGALPQETK